MEIFKVIQDVILTKLDFAIILLVIAVGEIVKKYWKTEKVNSFFKVLIPTLPLIVIYSFFAGVLVQKAMLSYLVAFWLYPLLIKYLLDFLGLRNELKTRKREYQYRQEIGGEIPDTDDEQR